MERAPIQYYPGHMASAMRRLGELVALIDLVIEVVDARIPRSGANPALAELAGARPRLTVLSRDDLAEPPATARWLEWYGAQRRPALALDARSRSSFGKLSCTLLELAAGARRKSARAIVLGIPNAGKSTVINGLVGRAVARTENRAGVTRAPQWFRLSPTLELMDTPGIMVPKIETPEAAWHLAACGALPRARFDPEQVVAELAAARVEFPPLEEFARERRIVRAGAEYDLHNAALAYLRELDAGRFGRMSLEEPPPPEAAA